MAIKYYTWLAPADASVSSKTSKLKLVKVAVDDAVEVNGAASELPLSASLTNSDRDYYFGVGGNHNVNLALSSVEFYDYDPATAASSFRNLESYSLPLSSLVLTASGTTPANSEGLSFEGDFYIKATANTVGFRGSTQTSMWTFWTFFSSSSSPSRLNLSYRRDGGNSLQLLSTATSSIVSYEDSNALYVDANAIRQMLSPSQLAAAQAVPDVSALWESAQDYTQVFEDSIGNLYTTSKDTMSQNATHIQKVWSGTGRTFEKVALFLTLSSMPADSTTTYSPTLRVRYYDSETNAKDGGSTGLVAEFSKTPTIKPIDVLNVSRGFILDRVGTSDAFTFTQAQYYYARIDRINSFGISLALQNQTNDSTGLYTVTENPTSAATWQAYTNKSVVSLSEVEVLAPNQAPTKPQVEIYIASSNSYVPYANSYISTEYVGFKQVLGGQSGSTLLKVTSTDDRDSTLEYTVSSFSRLSAENQQITSSGVSISTAGVLVTTDAFAVGERLTLSVKAVDSSGASSQDSIDIKLHFVEALTGTAPSSNSGGSFSASGVSSLSFVVGLEVAQDPQENELQVADPQNADSQIDVPVGSILIFAKDGVKRKYVKLKRLEGQTDAEFKKSYAVLEPLAPDRWEWTTAAKDLWEKWCNPDWVDPNAAP